MRYIVFSDLDGTLLDHFSYSFDPALNMISYLKQNSIPLIFNTSKTKKECEILQKKMGISEPFIVENGAAIYGFSKPIVLGLSFEELKPFLEDIKDRYKIVPFYDMSIEDLMSKTGFLYEDANIAKNREFSIPFIIEDEHNIEHIQNLAKKRDLKILKGGRFYHLVGASQDKGEAVRIVSKLLGDDLKTIGLGDSYNDLDMLRVVDIAVLIPNSSGEFIKSDIPNIKKAKFAGPKGWSKALEEIFDR